MKTIKEYLTINEMENISDNNPKIIVISNSLYGKQQKPYVDWYKTEKQLANEYSHDFIGKIKEMKDGEFKYIEATGFSGFVGKL